MSPSSALSDSHHRTETADTLCSPDVVHDDHCRLASFDITVVPSRPLGILFASHARISDSSCGNHRSSSSLCFRLAPVALCCIVHCKRMELHREHLAIRSRFHSAIGMSLRVRIRTACFKNASDTINMARCASHVLEQ